MIESIDYRLRKITGARGHSRPEDALIQLLYQRGFFDEFHNGAGSECGNTRLP